MFFFFESKCDFSINFWPSILLNKFNEIMINKANLLSIVYELKFNSRYQFKVISDIICFDYLGKLFRFGLCYILLSNLYNNRIRIITKIKENSPTIKSVTKYFSGSAWLEREVWDLFGVYFLGNTDLRRILTDYGFLGFPLRKDFPLVGFFEVFYNDISKKLSRQNLILLKEFKKYSLNYRSF